VVPRQSCVRGALATTGWIVRKLANAERFWLSTSRDATELLARTDESANAHALAAQPNLLDGGGEWQCLPADYV